MLEKIVKTKNPFLWIVLHISLGAACTILKESFIFWFFTASVGSILMLVRGGNRKRVVNLLYFITYFSSFELLARMTKAYKYNLPWEFGKYLVFFGAVYAILFLGSRKGLLGVVLILLLLPSVFFSGVNYEITWHNVVFNAFGPACVALVVFAFQGVTVTKAEFRNMLRLIFYPALSVLAYVVIETPDLTSMEFELGANFSATAGFGSNQVSSILGLGLFLTFIFWINRWTLSGNRKLDLIVMLGFAFQGLLSFSRGGMIGALIGIVMVVFFITKIGSISSFKYKLPSIGKFVMPILICLIVVFQVADSITGGMLTLRYQGETEGTLEGDAELDLNKLTTGRSDIFLQDITIWRENFWFGSGVGVSQYIRSIKTRSDITVSHLELSRLLAEHGFLGLIWFMLLLMLIFRLIKFNTNPKYQGILLACFLIAVYTTFHSATRTHITPLLIGISLLKIIDIKEPEHYVGS